MSETEAPKPAPTPPLTLTVSVSPEEVQAMVDRLVAERMKTAIETHVTSFLHADLRQQVYTYCRSKAAELLQAHQARIEAAFATRIDNRLVEATEAAAKEVLDKTVADMKAARLGRARKPRG